MPLLVSSEETSQRKARQQRQLLPFPRHSCLLPGACACADGAAGLRMGGGGEFPPDEAPTETGENQK